MKKLLLAAAVTIGFAALPTAVAQAQTVVIQPGFHGSGMHWDQRWRRHPGPRMRHPRHFQPRFRPRHFQPRFRHRFDGGFFFGGFGFHGGFGPPRCRSFWFDGWGWRCRW